MVSKKKKNKILSAFSPQMEKKNDIPLSLTVATFLNTLVIYFSCSFSSFSMGEESLRAMGASISQEFVRESERVSGWRGERRRGG